MNQRIPNPECRDGKHGNCDGHGWDIDADTAVRCPCHCHSKETSVHRHGPLVLDHHKGWQCNTCGDWLPLDYKGPEQVHPQARDLVTADGLRHIDNCAQCRQTFGVVGRIGHDEHEPAPQHEPMATQLAQAWCRCGQVFSARTLAGARRRLSDHIQGLPAQVDSNDTYNI